MDDGMQGRKSCRGAADLLFSSARDCWELFDELFVLLDAAHSAGASAGAQDLLHTLGAQALEASEPLLRLQQSLRQQIATMRTAPLEMLPERRSLEKALALRLRMSLWTSALTLAPAGHPYRESLELALGSARETVRQFDEAVEDLEAVAWPAIWNALGLVRAAWGGIPLAEAEAIEMARW